MIRFVRIAFLTIVVMGIPSGLPAQLLPGWAPPPSSAALIPVVDTIPPGGRLWLGIEIDLPDGWHTYWTNSGDAGAPAVIDWNLPPGWNAGTPRWPLPESYEEAGTITVAPNADPDAPDPPGIPAQPPRTAARGIVREGELVVRADGGVLPGSVGGAWFFPREWGAIDQSARQSWTRNGGEIVGVLTPGSSSEPVVRGLLVTPESRAVGRGYELEIEIAKE